MSAIVDTLNESTLTTPKMRELILKKVRQYLGSSTFVISSELIIYTVSIILYQSAIVNRLELAGISLDLKIEEQKKLLTRLCDLLETENYLPKVEKVILTLTSKEKVKELTKDITAGIVNKKITGIIL